MDLTIGCSSYNSPSVFFNGYIDEIRITKGLARYTSNFTPSSTAFSNADGSSELPANPSIGDTVYTDSAVYFYSSSNTWKRYAITPTTITP